MSAYQERVQGPCSYCGIRRAVNRDHVIPKTHRRYRLIDRVGRKRRPVRRAVPSAETRDMDRALLETVPACFECNVAKGARLLIPPSWADRLDELNDLGIGKFRVWHGDVESWRETVK